MATEPIRDPDGIPHVMIGIGALALLLIGAMSLMILSGHPSQHNGALLVLVLGVPGLIALIIAAVRRRRR